MNPYKRLALSGFFAFAVITAASVVLLTPGCATTGGSKPTTEAVIWFTLADTWNGASKVYDFYCDQVALKTVSEKDQADIDKAWNAFRTVYLIALEAYKGNELSPTPQTVEKLKDDLVILIYSL